jgi:hypothetical protein
MLAYGNSPNQIPERIQVAHHVSKETFEFLKNPLVSKYAATIEAPHTKLEYTYRLMLVLKQLGQTPEAFLENLRTKPEETGIELDSLLSAAKSKTGSMIAAAAIRKFAKFYRIRNFELTVTIRPKRVREKRPFTWETAEKVIAEAPQPYRDAFQMMLYGAMDENTFGLVNWNEKWNGQSPQDEIKTQMSNDKSYVKINLPPRKSSLDTYFVLIPKMFIPELPLVTRRFRGRGGSPVTARDLQHVWKRAARRVGIWHQGLGPHHLRVAFRSKCAELGIPVAAEWQMGHSGDKFGYDRSGIDEDFILDGPLDNGQRKGGLRRLWEMSPLVDRETIQTQLRQRDEKIAELEAKLEAWRKVTREDILQVIREDPGGLLTKALERVTLKKK